MKTVLYEEMLLDDFEKAVEETPIAYIPCGLLEWHSSHLPLGIDGLKIEELSKRIAQEYGGIVLPPFYTGAPGYTTYQGTITYRPSTVTQVFQETFEQLIKIGFKVIVAIGGHYGKPQENALRAAAVPFEDNKDVRIWILNEADVINDIGIFGDHAGAWETSMGLGLCHNLVDLARFKPGVQDIKKYQTDRWVEDVDLAAFDREYIIADDLENCLDMDEINKNIALVIERIGLQAGKLLQECMDNG